MLKSASLTACVFAGAVALMVAGAAQAETVKVADLDLATRAGQAAYAARAEKAVSKYCNREVGLARRAACREGVQAELEAWRAHATAVAEARARTRLAAEPARPES